MAFRSARVSVAPVGLQGKLRRSDREAEVVLDARLHADGHAVGHADRRRVRDEARLVVEDFVPRLGDGADGEVNRLGDADRHEDFPLPVILRAEAAGDIGGDGLAQLGRAEVRGVVRRAVLKRRHGRARDVPRRVEVRLAHAERDDVLALRDDVEELADPRLRQRGDVPCDEALSGHGRFRRWGASGRPRTPPADPWPCRS